jgi:hypothetical protein
MRVSVRIGYLTAMTMRIQYMRISVHAYIEHAYMYIQNMRISVMQTEPSQTCFNIDKHVHKMAPLIKHAHEMTHSSSDPSPLSSSRLAAALPPSLPLSHAHTDSDQRDETQ